MTTRKNIYRHILCVETLLMLVLSGCKPYDFLWDATDQFALSDAHSFLFVEVESTEYKGLAWTTEARIDMFFMDYDSVYRKMSNSEKYDKCHKYVYRKIKNNTIFPLKDSNNTFPYFFPLVEFDSSLYEIASQGIDTFINVFFDKDLLRGYPVIEVSKIMFDAGIYVKYHPLWIEDQRFITKRKNGRPYLSYTQRQIKKRHGNYKKEWKKVIPSSYIRKGKNWYKNTWQKHPKNPKYFKKTATPITPHIEQ